MIVGVCETGVCCVSLTPPKRHMQPENDDLQKESPFPGADFQVPYPIGSMGLVYLPYIYHKNQPNVGKYKIYPWILWVLNFRGVESQIINAPLLRQRGWPLKVFRVARSS